MDDLRAELQDMMSDMTRLRTDQAQAAELVRQAQNHTDAMAALSVTLGTLPHAMQSAAQAAQPPRVCGSD